MHHGANMGQLRFDIFWIHADNSRKRNMIVEDAYIISAAVKHLC